MRKLLFLWQINLTKVMSQTIPAIKSRYYISILRGIPQLTKQKLGYTTCNCFQHKEIQNAEMKVLKAMQVTPVVLHTGLLWKH